MKKYFFTLFAVMIALSLFFGSCAHKTVVETQRTTAAHTTAFEEKASFYDDLAKGDISVEIETTRGTAKYRITGDKDLLPAKAYKKIESVVSSRYERIYSKYGASYTVPVITVNIQLGYSKNTPCYAVGTQIYVNPNWFGEKDSGYDSLISAMAATTQTYQGEVPDWIKTGIQNCIRAEFATDYAKDDDWELPGSYSGHSYEEGGVYAAAFLKWVDGQVEGNFVYNLHRALQKGNFSSSYWKNETEMTLAQLWTLYRKAA